MPTLAEIFGDSDPSPWDPFQRALLSSPLDPENQPPTLKAVWSGQRRYPRSPDLELSAAPPPRPAEVQGAYIEGVRSSNPQLAQQLDTIERRFGPLTDSSRMYVLDSLGNGKSPGFVLQGLKQIRTGGLDEQHRRGPLDETAPPPPRVPQVSAPLLFSGAARPPLSAIFGIKDDRPPLDGIFAEPDFSDVAAGASTSQPASVVNLALAGPAGDAGAAVADRLAAKRAQLEDIKARGDLGTGGRFSTAEEQPAEAGWGSALKEGAASFLTGVGRQITDIPELPGRALAAAVEPFVKGAVYARPVTPGAGPGFAEMAAQRNQQAADTSVNFDLPGYSPFAAQVRAADEAQHERWLDAAVGLPTPVAAGIDWAKRTATNVLDPLNWIGAEGAAGAAGGRDAAIVASEQAAREARLAARAGDVLPAGVEATHFVHPEDVDALRQAVTGGGSWHIEQTPQGLHAVVQGPAGPARVPLREVAPAETAVPLALGDRSFFGSPLTAGDAAREALKRPITAREVEVARAAGVEPVSPGFGTGHDADAYGAWLDRAGQRDDQGLRDRFFELHHPDLPGIARDSLPLSKVAENIPENIPPAAPEPLYHVVTGGKWDGGDLLPLSSRLGDDATRQAKLVKLGQRWPDLIAGEDVADPASWQPSSWRHLEEYAAGDAGQVHLHDSLEAAQSFAKEHGGEILRVDPSGLDVKVGAEYPHPVVEGGIPASAIQRLEQGGQLGHGGLAGLTEGGEGGLAGRVGNESPVVGAVEDGGIHGSQSITTGTKNAVTEAERAARGLPEVEALGRKSSGENWLAAKAAFEADPEAARVLAAHVTESPRPLNAFENDLLLHDRMKLTLDHRDALAAEEQALAAGDTEGAAAAKIRRSSLEAAMETNDTAAKLSGTAWHESGMARQKLIAEDYSPLHLTARARVAAAEGGRELPEAVRQQLVETSKQLEAAQAQVAGYQERVSQLEAERAVQAAQRDAARVQRSTGRRASKEALDAEYRDLSAKFASLTNRPRAGLDPELAGLVARMARNRVQAGAKGLAEVVDGIYQDLSPHVEDLEPRDVRDAISGYGVTRSHPAQNEATQELARIKQQGRLVSRIEAISAGEPITAGASAARPDTPEIAALREKLRQVTVDTGARTTPSEAQRLAAVKSRLEKQIADAERGVVPRKSTQLPSPPEIQALRQQLQKTLEAEGLAPPPDLARVAAAEKTTQRSLADLEARISAGDITPRSATSSPWSAKLGEMKQQQVALRKQLDDMRKAARPPQDPEVLKIRAAERAAAKSVADLEKRIATGDLAPSGPTFSRWSPELGQLRLRQTELRQRLADFRKDAGLNIQSDATRLAALKQRLAVRATELEAGISTGSFPKKVRRPLAMDPEAIALQGRVEELKAKAESIIRREELKNRSVPEKALDATANWGRFLKLTGTATLQKIGAAAAERALVFKPLEEFIGAGVSKIPGVKQFAAQAPIEGGGSLKAVAKSYAGFFGQQARAELAAGLKGQEGAFSLAMSGAHPETGAPAWMQYPGRVHAGLKAPAKIAAFEFAMEKQAQHFLRRGQPEALSDLGKIAEMKARAYEYANRDIFMGDNAAVRKFRNAFRDEPGQSLAAKATNTTANVLMPIVKVPTNYALEATHYLAGIPKAGVKMGNVVAKGVKATAGQEDRQLADIVKAGLDALAARKGGASAADQADQIMMNLKKGSLGAGLIALGATGAVKVGGYYHPGEHRSEDELKPGQVQIGGHDTGIVLPHNLLHHPAVEALQVGGTIYRAKTLGQGLEDSAWGVAEQVPFLEEPLTAGRDLRKNPSKFLGQFERGMTLPPDGQRLARVLDQKEETTTGEKVGQYAGFGGLRVGSHAAIPEIEPVKRNPRGGFLEKMKKEEELGIPGLRPRAGGPPP